MNLFIFSLFFSKSIQYNPSLYAPKTDDYIVTLEADSFFFLENIQTPPKAKHIKEAHFSSQEIDENSYAWPGHDRIIDQSIEDQEGQNMHNFYKNRVNLTQSDMYYHPRAPEQTWSTWETINLLQRTKVKVTLDPYHKSHRTTNLYMPPGELITFEILPESINRVVVYTESHRQHVSINQRMKYLQCQTKLTQTINTWGYPTGGSITFDFEDLSSGFPIEINVTGCVIAPHFIYGVTDEKEWEETLRNSKAPSAQITNGAVNMYMPSFAVRNLDRMDDAQAWWRSAALRSEEIAPDASLANDRYNIYSPIHWRYDNFVGCGVACSIAGANIIDFYTDWANSANMIKSIKDENPWGTIHELNHHHQYMWGFQDLDESLYEGTNNVLNTFSYTYQNSMSRLRTVDADLNPICLTDHLETVHPYCLVDWNFIEAEWDIIIHCLGQEVFKKYMVLNTDNHPYSYQEFNGYGKHILTLMEATGYDCYEYCKWFCDNTDRKSPQELMGDKFDTFWKAYIKHPAHGKMFHFMGCFYACGFIRNDQRFETAQPYRIFPFVNTTFDFNKALKQRSGDKNLWGDFVFDRIESDRPESWTETSKGVFEYKPVDDLSFIDEALAIYIDKTTNEEFINIVRLELSPLNRTHIVSYYNFTEDVCKRSMSVEECYKNIDKHNLVRQFVTSYKGVPWINEKNLTAVTDITFTPTETGDYIFGATISERGFVYLSEEPLTGNFDVDSSHLILTKNWWHDLNNGDINGGKSQVIHLVSGKKMYMRLVVNNADDPSVCVPGQILCRSETGETPFVIKAENAEKGFTNNDVIPDDWFRIGTERDFRPILIDFKNNDVYRGETIIKNNPNGWTANVSMEIKSVYNLTNTDYDWSQGKKCETCTEEDIGKTLLSWDETTEVRVGWWPSDQRQPFPHKFDVNFNKEEEFDVVYLKGAYNQGNFPMISNVSVYINTKDATSDGIESEENLIWKGVYSSKNSPALRLDKFYKGKYIRVVVHDNNQTWRGEENPGMSDFSVISVGRYSCVSKYKVPRGCKWEVRKDGYYLNGRSFVGKKGDTYSYTPDEGINQIAIVGDRFPGMGVAKVFIDNEHVKTIDDTDMDFYDTKALKFASRSYRRMLYVSPIFFNRPTIRIEVMSGEFRLTGFIVGTENESVIINNGPMPTRTPRAYETSSPDDDGDDGNRKGKSNIVIISVSVVVSVVVLVAAVVIGILIYKKKRKSNNDSSAVLMESSITNESFKLN